MSRADRLLATIRRQAATIRRLRLTIHALRHYATTEAARAYATRLASTLDSRVRRKAARLLDEQRLAQRAAFHPPRVHRVGT